MNTKNHYVVFGYDNDCFRLMFKDAVVRLGVEYIDNPIRCAKKNILMQMLYNLHRNEYINYFYNIPYKERWYKHYYTKPDTAGSLCFVFLICWAEKKYIPLFKHLKEKYPKAKMVLYLEDVISSRKGWDNDILRYFDKVVSYDKGDATKYGFPYFPTFMSKSDVRGLNNISDVCFIGAAKNRMDIIGSLYNKLCGEGLVCDFIVSHAGKDVQKLYPGIKYKKRGISYKQYLSHVKSSKCIVEIMQNNADGYTLRTWESLLYNKKLLTNNTQIKKAEFYNSNQFLIFSDVNQIDTEMIRKDLPVESKTFDCGSISSVRFFEFLDSLFD